MSLPLFFTTTTAPPWIVFFADPSGNVPPGFSGAACTLTFRSLTTEAKYRATGSFVPTNANTGAATFTPYAGPPTDFANAYAISALGSAVGGALPGVETFEILSEAVVGSNVYDGIPWQIAIRKI